MAVCQRGVAEFSGYILPSIACLLLLLLNELTPTSPDDTNSNNQAKELVEGAPKVIKKEVKKEEAEKLVAKLKEVGAVVELV